MTNCLLLVNCLNTEKINKGFLLNRFVKKRKKKKSKELKSLGFLIPTAKICAEIKKKKHCIGELERCDFDGECQYCSKPRKGSYASMSRGCDFVEVNFYICGKCAIAGHYKYRLHELIEAQYWANFEVDA